MQKVLVAHGAHNGTKPRFISHILSFIPILSLIMVVLQGQTSYVPAQLEASWKQGQTHFAFFGVYMEYLSLGLRDKDLWEVSLDRKSKSR